MLIGFVLTWMIIESQKKYSQRWYNSFNIKSDPNCQSMLIPSHKATTPAAMKQRIRRCLWEVQKDHTQLCGFDYAGHGIKQGDKLYLVPKGAGVEEVDHVW